MVLVCLLGFVVFCGFAQWCLRWVGFCSFGAFGVLWVDMNIGFPGLVVGGFGVLLWVSVVLHLIWYLWPCFCGACFAGC